jgi:uncharacterized membrane protein HdeD (DUF308 family)
MLAVLAVHWRLLFVRSVLALGFGALALIWPGLTLAVLVVLFGSYAVLNGLLALTIALTSRSTPGFAGLLLEGVLGIAAGVFTLLYPGIATVVLLGVIAAWAIMTGIAAFMTAAALRTEMSGDWPLPLAGVLALMLGVLLLVQPAAGALAVAWMIGGYAVLAGASQLALAIRMRHLAQEIAHA